MIKRPDCFDFAMDFLGDWEATEIRRYVEGLETDARKVPDDGLASFAEYFCHNYPSDTIIGRPEWHAPKIFRAAIYAINDAAKRNAAPPARECAPPFDKTWLIAALNVHRHLGVPPRDSDFMLWKRENDKWLGEAVAALREYAGLAAGAAPERPHAIEIDVYGGPEEAPAAEPCYYCGRVHSEADPYCVKPAAEPAPDEYMCPNCVTPWKCNGPHIDRTLLREDQEREDAK